MIGESEAAVDIRNYMLLAGTIFGSIIAGVRLAATQLSKKIQEGLRPEVARIDERINLLVLHGIKRDEQLTEHMEVEQAKMEGIDRSLHHITTTLDQMNRVCENHEDRISRLEERHP